jgi:C4-dicarboxylate-specific signal transduction histidine kinase
MLINMATSNPPIAVPTSARTSELLEQLLQIARISALEEMASGIAHEINQPIGAIATFAQAARRMLKQPEPSLSALDEVLEMINVEALNAGQGMRRIRSLFNARSAERSTCRLDEVVEELSPVLELLARRSGAHFSTKVQADLPPVSINRLCIQHVLFSLVQNALEAPRRADVTPAVAVELTGDRYTVQTTVSDCGTGVAGEVADQLFRPFYTTKRQGTGLGLASGRAIIEAHEGSIGFENRPDGAQFWFRLPAVSGVTL